MVFDVCKDQFTLINGTCVFQCPPGRSISRMECAEICGDGVKLEGLSRFYCDDGNTQDEDGCAAFCFVEAGYYCKGGGPLMKDICLIVPDWEVKQSETDKNALLLISNQPFEALEDTGRADSQAFLD